MGMRYFFFLFFFLTYILTQVVSIGSGGVNGHTFTKMLFERDLLIEDKISDPHMMVVVPSPNISLRGLNLGDLPSTLFFASMSMSCLLTLQTTLCRCTYVSAYLEADKSVG